MTNKEYFEQNNISFADALKEYDATKHGTVEQFLYAERMKKFKPGDIVVGTNSTFRVNIILRIDENGKYVTKFHDGYEWVRFKDFNDEMDRGCSKIGEVDIGSPVLTDEDKGHIVCFRFDNDLL